MLNVKLNNNLNPNPDFERLRKVLLRDGIPDKVPFYEHFVDDEIIEAITGLLITKLDLAKKDEKEKYYKTKIDFYYQLGYDYVPIEVPTLTTYTLSTDDTAQLPRQQRNWQDENKGPISNWDEFEKYPWPKKGNELDYSVFEISIKNLPDGMKIIGGVAGGIFEHLSQLMGLVPLSYALYDNPDLVQAIVDKIGEVIYTADTNIIQICGNKLGALRMGDDMGYKTSTMLPPVMLKKYIFPWQKRIVEIAHKNNLPFILHSCGQLEDIMDDLINFVGIDAKHSFEDIIMPVTEFKKKYGDRISVLGGVDVDKLCRLPEQELRKYVRNILDICASDGGYALGSGNTITNYMNINNYLAMLDEGQNWHY